MKNELNIELEKLIDSKGLQTVIWALAEVCGEKAEHIRSNWQDSVTARAWDVMAVTLDKQADKAATLSL